MADVVVIGGCVIDLISYTDVFPKPGETVVGNRFSKGFGGKGANQCVMAQRLGAQTAMIAKVGDDAFGHEYLNNFRENQINYDHVTITKETHTSTATICVAGDGQNTIVYVPGAVNALTIADIQRAEPNLIAGAKVMACVFECPMDTLKAALEAAKRHGVYTMVNAAPALSKPREDFYHLCDIVCVNEIEAGVATGIPVNSVKDAKLAIEILQGKGCRTVIVTLGEAGAVFGLPGQGCAHVPARVVTPVDSTGAGDAFMGTLAYLTARLPDLPFAEKIRRSCEVATMSVLGHGTQSSFPARNEIPSEFFT